MATRRFVNSRGRFAKGFSRLAKKQRIWVWTEISITESAGTATNISLVVAAQWQRNATLGNQEKCKAIWQSVFLTATPQASDADYGNRYYAMAAYADDASDLTDPTGAAYYQNIPAPYRTGGLIISPATAGSDTQPVYAGNRDFVRTHRVNRLLTTGDRLWLTIQPAAAAANVVSYSGFARTLLEYM